MQTLSLDNYGVSELSHSEQGEIDGGLFASGLWDFHLFTWDAWHLGKSVEMA
jgi:hypothetical protein